MRRLIIRPGAIGDFIVSLPALEWLRTDYTEVWCPRACVPLAGFADRAVAIADTGLDRVGIMHCEDAIERLARFDSIVSWYGAQRPEFREAVPGAVFHEALPFGMHAVDFYLTQVGAKVGGVPRVKVKMAGETACPTTTARVIHPFSGSLRKNWPLERFQDLGARLGAKFCCGPEEALPGAAQFADLGELAQWLAGAQLFIGNDSGIAHLAAAVGTPVVAIFGPTDPAIWAPRGPWVSVIAKPALDEISVDEVYAAALHLISPAYT
jgi:hypothetical protein